MSAWTENRLGLLTVAGIALLNLVVVGMVAVNGPVSPSGGYDTEQVSPGVPAQQLPSDQSDQGTQSPSPASESTSVPSPDPQPSEPGTADAPKPADSSAPVDPPATSSAPPAPDSPSPPDSPADSAPAPPDSDKNQGTPIVIPIPPSHHDSGDNPRSDGAVASGDNAGAAPDTGAKPSSNSAGASGTSSPDSGAGAPADSGKP